MFARLFDRTTVAFTTPEVSRVFLACKDCQRVKPHYHLYAAHVKQAKPRCRCGCAVFKPREISELRAAFLLVVVGWFWRHKVRGFTEWDPRLPLRMGR